jgi:hypothetical protein
VGVPDEEITLQLTVTAWPGADGSGLSPVILVDVPPGGGGGGASTSTVAEDTSLAPSLSVAVRVTVYVPGPA